jgi:hypothetical protein
MGNMILFLDVVTAGSGGLDMGSPFFVILLLGLDFEFISNSLTL